MVIVLFIAGVVAVRHAENGKMIHELNCPIKQGKPKDGSTVKSDPLVKTLTGYELGGKANMIEKVGKWVICGFQDGRVCIYDVGVAEQNPIEEFHKKGVIKGILVENEQIFIMTKKKSEKYSNKKGVISVFSWSPHFKKEESKEFELLSKYRIRVLFSQKKNLIVHIKFFFIIDSK